MYSCQICGKLEISGNEFRNHLKYIHNVGYTNFTQMVCPRHSCQIEITNWSGFLATFKVA
jgi:hypothetical protein